MMIGISQEQLREQLLIELERQEKTRRNFSLRGFANQLKISHSLLSLLASGKRPITQKTWEKITFAMPALAIKTGQPLDLDSKFEQLTLNDFAAISEWYYYAILSLLEIKGFHLDYRWISERLSITPLQAQTAISRLKTMGIIAKKNGQWKQIRGPLKVENKKPLHSSRVQQHQLIDKALESLEKDPFEVRDFSSMTFALDPSLIPYARERIKNFRRSLVSDLERKANGKEVYHLTVQIYPVSKPVVEGEKHT